MADKVKGKGPKQKAIGLDSLFSVFLSDFSDSDSSDCAEGNMGRKKTRATPYAPGMSPLERLSSETKSDIVSFLDLASYRILARTSRHLTDAFDPANTTRVVVGAVGLEFAPLALMHFKTKDLGSLAHNGQGAIDDAIVKLGGLRHDWSAKAVLPRISLRAADQMVAFHKSVLDNADDFLWKVMAVTEAKFGDNGCQTPPGIPFPPSVCSAYTDTERARVVRAFYINEIAVNIFWNSELFRAPWATPAVIGKLKGGFWANFAPWERELAHCVMDKFKSDKVFVSR
jgi:hypothetical protein